MALRCRLAVRSLFLCLALALAAMSLSGLAGADPQVALEEARAAIARGDRDAAIAKLEEAVSQDSRFTVAYRWLSRLYADKGLRDEAIDAAAAVLRLNPEHADRDNLMRLLAAGMPACMASLTPDSLPLPQVLIRLDLAPDRPGQTPEARNALVLRDETRLAPAQDPKFGGRYDRASYGYVLDVINGRWRLTFTAHYLAASPARGDLAAKCVGLLLRAACVGEAHLGSQVIGDKPHDVWLAEDGTPGAASWGESIYVLNVGAQREPAEWVRQVLHEYGHAVLPGIDHFAQPEPWANGRLGEQLFAQWLGQSRESGAGHPWLTAQPPDQEGQSAPAPVATLAALIKDADRCLEAFLDAGPSSDLMAENTQAATDYYLGFANYVERAFGSDVLATAMRLTAGNRCRDFAVGVQQALTRRATSEIALRSFGQQREAVREWVYLAGGKWQAKSDGSPECVSFNGRAVGVDFQDVGRIATGWHSVVLPSGATVTFRRSATSGH